MQNEDYIDNHSYLLSPLNANDSRLTIKDEAILEDRNLAFTNERS